MKQRFISCFVWISAVAFLFCVTYSFYLPVNQTYFKLLRMRSFYANHSGTSITSRFHMTETPARSNSIYVNGSSRASESVRLTTTKPPSVRANSSRTSPFTPIRNVTSGASGTQITNGLSYHDCKSLRTSLVFIKTHKTGSTTLQAIINRFGFFRNLSFVFNKRSAFGNGHFYEIPIDDRSHRLYFLPPLKVKQGDYKNYFYDVLAVHVRYKRSAMDKVMKSGNGTKYITIIREPVSQWESAFDQFIFQEAFQNASLIPQDKWIEKFLEKPEYYKKHLKTLKFEGQVGRRYYYAQNSQLYDLGLDMIDFGNETVINATIRKLDKEFTLILLTEYFDESLLILKKELCWDYKDMVYISKNSREGRQNLTAETRQKILNWNRADVLLYDYFNKTLWRKVKDYGPAFKADLDTFRKLNHQVFDECINSTISTHRLLKRQYNHVEFRPKKNSTLFCQTVAESKRALLGRVYSRQNPNKKRTRGRIPARKPPSGPSSLYRRRSYRRTRARSKHVPRRQSPPKSQPNAPKRQSPKRQSPPKRQPSAPKRQR